MSNKSNGTAFEWEFANMLYKHGFWVHRMQDNQNGQPFDIIAAKDMIAYGFDCKDCQRSIFRLSRIEENQMLAMRLWWQCGNGNAFFAIRMPTIGIRLISYITVMTLLDAGISSITESVMAMQSSSFDDFVMEMME